MADVVATREHRISIFGRAVDLVRDEAGHIRAALHGDDERAIMEHIASTDAGREYAVVEDGAPSPFTGAGPLETLAAAAEGAKVPDEQIPPPPASDPPVEAAGDGADDPNDPASEER
jgi:hypothetical protein